MQRHEESNEIKRAMQQQETVDRRRAELMSLLIEGGSSTNSTTADTGLAQRHLQGTIATATISTADLRLEQSLQLLNQGRLNVRNVGDIHDQLSSTASAGAGTDFSSLTTMRPTDQEYSRAYSFLASQQPDRQRLPVALATALSVLQNERQTLGSLFVNPRQAQQQSTSNNSVIQHLLAESELREREVLQLAQLEQLQSAQRHLFVALQQNNSAGADSATLARALLLSGETRPSATMLHQQSPLRARVPSMGNEFNDFNLRRTSALSFLEHRWENINNLNSTVAGSLTDEQLLRHYQDLRLYPSSLFQYRDATTPPKVVGTRGIPSDQIGSIRATLEARSRANDPIILESGLCGFMQRKKLNLLVDEGKSDENLPRKKRMKLADQDYMLQTEGTKLFLKTPTPSTTAMFPLPEITEKKELKLHLSSSTFSTFRNVWESAGEQGKHNPTLQKELFQRKITEQRLYYTGTSVSANKGLKKSASPNSD